MNIKKGDKFKDYMGTPCFISYIKGDIVKLSFIEERPHMETWDKAEFLDEIRGNRFFPQPKEPINRTNITSTNGVTLISAIGLFLFAFCPNAKGSSSN